MLYIMHQQIRTVGAFMVHTWFTVRIRYARKLCINNVCTCIRTSVRSQPIYCGALVNLSTGGCGAIKEKRTGPSSTFLTLTNMGTVSNFLTAQNEISSRASKSS